MFRKKEPTTWEAYLAEKLEDPKFRKAYEEAQVTFKKAWDEAIESLQSQMRQRSQVLDESEEE